MLGPQVSHPPLFKTPEDDAQSKPHETAEIFTFKLWKKRTNQLDDKSFLFHYFPISIGPKKKIGGPFRPTAGGVFQSYRYLEISKSSNMTCG